MVCIVYLSLLLYIYDQFGCRQYSSTIRGACPDTNWVNKVMHMEAVIELVWRCTWMEAVIKWTQTFTLWLTYSDHDDGLEDWHLVSLEMHLKAMVMSTWRPWWNQFAVILGGHSSVNLEASNRKWRCTWGHDCETLEAVIKWVCRCSWSLKLCY